MPVSLSPSRTATKRVTPPDLNPAREWFAILTFLDDKTLKDARAKATKTIVQGSKTREEVDQDVFNSAVIAAQLKGWQLEVPAETGFDPARMTNDNGIVHWQFTPENVEELLGLWDARVWLANEVLSCGGIIATASLSIETESGQTLDYKSADVVVGPGEEPQVSPAQ